MSLHLVTGKGGVGKTRVAALLSQNYSKAMLFDCAFELATELQKLSLSNREILYRNNDQIIFRAIRPFLKIESLAKWTSENKLVQNLFRLAPNLLEFLLLYQWVEFSKERELVVDAPSTGNFLGILRSVQTARKMFDAGRLKKMADEIEFFLNDPKKTFFYLVSLPETSALHEMEELKKEIVELYPRANLQEVLNRKHEVLPRDAAVREALPEALHFLAYDRPQLEARRIEKYSFKYCVLEGGRSFV